MIKRKLKALAGGIVLASMLGGMALPAYAQNSTTTYDGTSVTTYYYSTTSSSAATTTGTTATSTLSVQGRIALLQTQVVVLFGRVIGNIAAQATSSPTLAEPVRRLQQAWIGLALSHLSTIRARLGL